MSPRLKRGLKRGLLVLAGFMLVAVVLVVITTPSIAGHRQRMRIHYHHKIRPVKVYTRSGDQTQCAKAIEGFEGKAVLGHERLIGGGMSIKFCYRIVQGPLATSPIVGKPVVNSWGDGRWGWNFEGVISKVKGHGTHCSDSHCWEYVYRRYYYKFTRNVKLFTQTCTPFINITVRGNGSYVTGHSDGGIC